MKKQKKTLVVLDYPNLTINTTVDYKFAVVIKELYPKERIEHFKANSVNVSALKENQIELEVFWSKTEKNAANRLKQLDFSMNRQPHSLVVENGWTVAEIKPVDILK